MTRRRAPSCCTALAAMLMVWAPVTAAAMGVAAPQDSAQRARTDSAAYANRVTIQKLDAAARAAAIRRRRADSARLTTQIAGAVPTAFADAGARMLLERARAARLRQDSALLAYSVRETQRTTVRAGIGRTGPKRTIMRADNVAQVEWSRSGGARITPLGSRVTSDFTPGANDHAAEMVSVPYYPGRDQLWMPMGSQLVRTDIDEHSLVHPIARGAETYYRYATGDSVDIRLPDGRTIAIRELRVTARRPEWRAFVGSFWFDVGSGLLVRAVYRLAADLETGHLNGNSEMLDAEIRAEYERLRDSSIRATLPADAVSRDSAQRAQGRDKGPQVPGFLKAFVPPSRARIESITTEYGLYEGRFWLPRMNSLQAVAEVGFFRVPVEMDEKYAYDHVNGTVDLPPNSATAVLGNPLRCTGVMVGVSVCESNLDTAATAARARRMSGDSVVRCATDSTFTRRTFVAAGAVPLSYRMPCRTEALRSSALLPPPDASTDRLFDSPTRDELRRLLDMGLQPAWSPRLPTLHTGADMARYNRVEGFSLGLRADQQFGSGYALSATGRIGHADLHANGELSIARTNLRRTLRAGVYHRLSPVNPEWTGELSFRTSLPALLYGRDDAFYMRNYGAELTDRRESHDGFFEARLFAERQWTAGDSGVRRTFSLLGPDFLPNIVASRALQSGIAFDASRSFEPRLGVSWRTGLRAEAATGTFDYAKGALDVTGTGGIGVLQLSLTGSAGTSGGTLPAQRLWYVGGLRTVRGQLAGAQSGNAFWLTRVEAGAGRGVVRPVLFFDAGWSGPRTRFGLSDMQQGVGVGASFFNGLVRGDLSRGLTPRKKWRFDIYLQAPL